MQSGYVSYYLCKHQKGKLPGVERRVSHAR
jgi:hypothetical protein